MEFSVKKQKQIHKESALARVTRVVAKLGPEAKTNAYYVLSLSIHISQSSSISLSHVGLCTAPQMTLISSPVSYSPHFLSLSEKHSPLHSLLIKTLPILVKF